MSMTSALKTQIVYNSSYFNLNFAGKIRDPLHDTIPYTVAEKFILDKPEFQRLRRIRQTAFIQYVFPGATHTRFEHSLGAMHIAGLMYTAIIGNQRRILDSLEQAFKTTKEDYQNDFARFECHAGSLLHTKQGLEYLEKSSYLAQCLRFAALLHDCGHSALSHSGERFMPSWKMLDEHCSKLNLPEWLQTSLKIKISKAENLAERINHEIYTLLIVQSLFCENDELLSEKMGQDICSILDTSIPPHPDSDLAKSGMKCLFHEMISGEIDVDRMDYLLRDSQECGVVYGYFDLGRILDSLGFYLNESAGEYHLALRRSGISAYEDYLRARLSMYNQVYFHKTATACEAMLEYIKKKSPLLYFPLDLNIYVNIDDYNILNFFMDSISEKNSPYLHNFIRDLLYERKLWKRVYEESIPFQAIKNSSSLCPIILNFLKENKIPAELVETSTNLTRFSPRGKGDLSKNNFKVIIKNVNSLRFLEPIENQSNLINRVDEEFLIRRIYIAQYNEYGEKIDTNTIQKLLSERILS